MTIINLRGTSGSGKSTVVRNVMALYSQRLKIKQAGRKQPIGYVLNYGTGTRVLPLALVGHYETDCGGCDTIANMDEIYENVRKAHAAGMDVLYEGLLISADANRVIALHSDGLPVRVIALSTPLDLCIQSVNARRLANAAAKGKPYKGDVNPKNTTSKFAGVKSSMKRIEAAGIECSWNTREGALVMIKQAFNI